MDSRLLLVSFCISFYLVFDHCLAVEYHVDAKAAFSGKGSAASPFKTIQEAANKMLPGDVCIIHEGTYMEIVIPSHSGLTGKELTFRAAPEETVVITGTDQINSATWEQTAPGIYRTKLEMSLGHENQIFLGRKMLVEARWPNTGNDLLSPTLSEMADGTTPEMIVDDQLPDVDWTGANVWIHARGYWSNWTTKILDQKPGAINIENVAPYPGPNQHVASPGAKYFIYGCLSALDTANEWYYDSKEMYLYVFSGNQRPNDILIKRRMYAFDLSGKSHIKLEGIQVFGASIKMDSMTSHIRMDKLRFLYPYHSSQANVYYGDQTDKGILLNGKYCSIINSEIAYSSGCGIVLGGEQNHVINCFIHDTDYIGTYASAIQLKGKGNVISHCTLSRSGRAVIDYRGMYQSLIQYCDLSGGGMLTSDTGLTYGNIIEGGNSEVRYNFIHDNKDDHLAMGLYYDHGTQNILSHHNIVWGVDDFGLLINHYSYYHEIYNNTFSSGRIGFRSRWGNKYEPDLYGCRFFNNVFNNPTETNAGNYAWGYNLENYKGLDKQNRLPSGSPAIDAGIIIKGINEDYIGEAPDLGAFESGVEKWKPGHNFDMPPVPDLSRSDSPYRNRIVNSAFEHEDHLFPWDTIGEVNIIHGFKNQTTPDTATIRMGRWSVSLKSGAEVYQTINGLKPNTWYEFAGLLRVETGERAFLGVRNKDGRKWHSPSMTGNSPNWNRGILHFKTDQKQTSVTVFVRKTAEGNGRAYLDDCGLIYVREGE